MVADSKQSTLPAAASQKPSLNVPASPIQSYLQRSACNINYRRRLKRGSISSFSTRRLISATPSKWERLPRKSLLPGVLGLIGFVSPSPTLFVDRRGDSFLPNPMTPIPTRKLPGTSLHASMLCLGGVFFGNELDERATFALLDRFAELGGNFIDTARIYSDWIPGETSRSERILGDWIKSRGRRDALVIATKGAHPFLQSLDQPRTSAAEIRADLEGSLRSLRLEKIDLYWLHRDDATRPVEHYIDLLNTFVREGKVHAFGASNWTAARLRAANAYARESGQLGFAADQPFWCLGVAQSRPPPYSGYVKFDRELDRFHQETHLPVVAYTSQANGFFSKFALSSNERPANFEKHDFHTPPNVAAARIVLELAAAKRVTPSAIVLGYLLSRTYAVFPIIGCRTLAQLENSAIAPQVRLSTDELQRLESASQSGLVVN